MDVVTDTHSIVWYFTNDPMLSKRALEAFEKTTKEGLIVIPAVVLAEMMFIAKKGKIVLNFEKILKIMEEYDNIEVAPLDIDILKIANKIEKELELHPTPYAFCSYNPSNSSNSITAALHHFFSSNLKPFSFDLFPHSFSSLKRPCSELHHSPAIFLCRV